MEIPDIQPNSNKYKAEKAKNAQDEHRLQRVTKGTAKKSQTSSLQKFVKSFLPEDAKSVKDYVIEETPGLIQGFLRRLLQNLLDTYLPDKGRYSSNVRGGTNTVFRYDNIRGSSAAPSGLRSRNTNAVYEYENVTFEDYEDAKEVLENLYDCLGRFDKVRVFDLYDLAGVVATSTDRNYGWTDLRGTKIVPTREGYVIDLPRAIQLN